MSDYNERKEYRRWGGSTIWIIAVGMIVLIPLGFGLHSAGIIGKTIVEREVFEQSYQYTAAQKAKIANFEAQMAEIDRQLAGQLDDATRQNLEAQAAAIRVQLTAARATQE